VRTRPCARLCAALTAPAGRRCSTSSPEGVRIATPSTDQLRQFDGGRALKRVSDADGVTPADRQFNVARMKDDRPRLAYMPERAVDLNGLPASGPCCTLEEP
jgi:hypothetical protein